MIGRELQSECLKESVMKGEAQLIAVYGRRRVGKTYLVREVFGDRFFFHHSGLAKGTMDEQLSAFRDSLAKYGLKNVPVLANWREAFNELERLIESGGRKRKVLFIDELPWLDTPKSGFVKWFEHFWNGFASGRKEVVLVICGSASSWIVKNVFRNRGGLHNRVTDTIRLQPFTLHECRLMCKSMGLGFGERDIAELYMIFGGIPYYWSLLKKGESVAQAIDRLVFAPDGKLRFEFRELYASLFGESSAYIDIVKTLAKVKSGQFAGELMKGARLSKGGNVKRYFDDLEQCGFIRRYTAFGKKKRDAHYQLIDNFSLFHLRFLEDESNHDEHFWQHGTKGATLNTWRGLAFERLCLWHVPQIKAALGISGVLTEVYAWRHVPDDVRPWGVQIDLLLDRADRVINVCEMKYVSDEYVIDAEAEKALIRKCETFSAVTKTRCAVHLTLVTTKGVFKNTHSGIVQSEVTLDDLFRA